MIIEKSGKEKITISFSNSVGKKGLDSIKKYIEGISKNSFFYLTSPLIPLQKRGKGKFLEMPLK